MFYTHILVLFLGFHRTLSLLVATTGIVSKLTKLRTSHLKLYLLNSRCVKEYFIQNVKSVWYKYIFYVMYECISCIMHQFLNTKFFPVPWSMQDPGLLQAQFPGISILSYFFLSNKHQFSSDNFDIFHPALSRFSKNFFILECLAFYPHVLTIIIFLFQFLRQCLVLCTDLFNPKGFVKSVVSLIGAEFKVEIV